MNNNVLSENNMADEIKAGLNKGDFEIYYQPVFSMTEERPIYAEALLRWNRKKGQKLSAAEFIPAVEKNGCLKDLDIYVLEKVCRQMQIWKNDACPLLPVSVNISKAGIFDIDLCEEMVALTEKYGIDHSLLNIEITGTGYEYDPELLQKKIKALKNAGFSVIIDDFGNGSSSLKMLKDIPFDILKIDRELFGEFETDEKVAGILTSVMRMAKWLSISVITEGVESENQRQFLKNIGCSMMQGYYFLRPVPADKFMEYVKKNKNKHRKDGETGILTFDAGSILDNDVIMNMIYHKFMEGVGIYEVIGDKLRIIRVNEGYCRMFGYDPKAMPEGADNVYLMAHEDYRGILMEECQKIAREKGERQFEFLRKTGYGKYLWVWAGGTYIGMKNDHPVICFLLRDITRYVESQKQAEIKVSKQRELYMKLMEDTNIGIFEIDIEKDELVIYMKMPDGQRKDFIIKGIVSEQGDLSDDNIIMKKISPENKNIFNEIIKAAEKSDQNGEFEYRADYYGDGYKWYRSYYESVFDQEKSKVTNIIGRTVSIEKEKEMERRLKQEKAYRAAVFKEMLVVYEMDITLDISVPMYRNQKRAGEYFPFNYYTDFEKSRDYIHSEDFEDVKKCFQAAFSGELLKKGIEDVKKKYRIKDRKDNFMWIEMTAHMFIEETTENLKAIVYIEEIDEEKRKVDKLENKAQIDAVSRIYNRGTTEEKINNALEKRDEGCQHTLFIVDIDDFKVVNDTFGHLAGDDILRKIGEIFKGIFRKTDIVGRIGGDEFAVLMTNVTSDRQITDRMKLVMGEIHGLPAKMGIGINVSVSVGITRSVAEDKEFDDMYKRADLAMYEAKTKGKDRFIIK